MQRAIGYLIIFGLGFALCMALLRASGGFGITPDSQARRNALRLLDQNVPAPPIPDTAIVTAADKIVPAVVNIDTLVTGRTRQESFYGPSIRTFLMQGKGSGVIISPDGFIVTNNHVIEGANIIKVTLPDQKQYDGRIIGADPDADLAVVKIEAANLPYAIPGDSEKLKVGEYVLAIGYPLGFGTTVTHGIVSAADRHDLEIAEGHILKHAIQTDAPINKGNSGGALADLNGRLVGINTAIYTENNGGNIGIGFAIPINAAKAILHRLIEDGRNQAPPGPGAPFLGILYDGRAPLVEGDLNGRRVAGVRVTRVVPLTAAAAAGIQTNDVIISIDGHSLSAPMDVSNLLAKRRVGEQAIVTVVHPDGTREDKHVTIGRRPELPAN